MLHRWDVQHVMHAIQRLQAGASRGEAVDPGLVVSAKSVAANTYKLSGAVTGTLRDGPDAGCPYGGINNNGFIELNDLVGSVSGIKGVASWRLDVTVKKNGTYSFRSLTGRTPTAILSVDLKGKNITDSIQKGEQDNFFAHGGTVTVKGE